MTMSDIMNEYADVCKERNALKAENAGWLEKSSYCMSTHMAQIESLKAEVEKLRNQPIYGPSVLESLMVIEKDRDRWKKELEDYKFQTKHAVGYWKSEAERYEVLAERAREALKYIGLQLERGSSTIAIQKTVREALKSFDDKCHICGDIEDKSICSRCKPVDDKGPKKMNNLTYEDTL